MAYIGRGLNNGVRNQFIFAATQGQTAFTGADSGGKTLAISDILYTDCYQNGVKLKPTTDYTVSLTTLTLVSAASLNDVVDIVAFDIFGVPDTVPASTGGTFGGGITATTGTFSGKITADAGIDIDNFNIDGNTIALSSGHINLDSAGQIFLDGADDGTVQLRNSGTNYGNLYSISGGDWYFKSVVSDKDILFQGVDGGSQIIALTLDMSDAGTATFKSKVGIGAVPNATFGSLLYVQGTPAANKPIISGYSQGNSNKAGFALFNDVGNRGIWTSGNDLIFTSGYESNSTEHMRIDSNGNFMVGGTSNDPIASGSSNLAVTSGFININKANNIAAYVGRSGSDGAVVAFYKGTSNVGLINVNGSSTAYATSSDYRLKENVDYTWDATTRLKQLKPARFNFIADESNTLVDGFLAHEVSSIVPEAITGTKDAMTTEVLYVDGDELPDGKSVGDVKQASVPDMQGIDQSKLVPLLVKTIQELEARITALEA